MTGVKIKDSKVKGANAKSVSGKYRVVLVIVDFPSHDSKALFYACRYALQHGCRISLLYVRPKFQANPLLFLGRATERQSRAFAEDYAQEVSAQVQKWGCSVPSVYMREGDVVQEVSQLLSEPEHHVALVVISAKTFIATSAALVKVSAGKNKDQFRPFVVVPNGLSFDEVEKLI